MKYSQKVSLRKAGAVLCAVLLGSILINAIPRKALLLFCGVSVLGTSFIVLAFHAALQIESISDKDASEYKEFLKTSQKELDTLLGKNQTSSDIKKDA